MLEQTISNSRQLTIAEATGRTYTPEPLPTQEEIDAAWARVEVRIGDDGLEYSFEDGEKAICGAHRKNDLPCRKAPMIGRNRCEDHGGKSPRGLSHPRFKNGRYSKDVPARLAARYEQAQADPKLLELRGDIAVVEARIADLLSRVDTGESGAMWKAIKRLYNEMRDAVQRGDQQQFAQLLNDLGKVINKGQSDYLNWDEVLKTISARRRLVESERKRLVEMKQLMTAEQAMGMLGFVVNVIKKRTYEIVPGETGQRLLAAISADIGQYVAGRQPSKPDMHDSEPDDDE